MAEALYRKYRPLTFSDVVGQEHIERTLKNAIEKGKVSHAYLFCGPRGTGKTTTARILAKAMLCQNGPTIDPDGTCEDCEAIAQGNHPDVYELDAASRTGVENVREEIISRVHYAPTRGVVKIYIIDEVHMLSTAAFNALLKTLEEPPSHVVFILCTTDPQKVPETIHSRCQRFDFHRISSDAIVARLGAVCVKEGVEFQPEALELIAHRAEGGMRNALTSLEQLIAFGEGSVTLAGAQSLLGSLDNAGLSEIVQAIGKRDVAACFTWTAHYVETGADLAQFVRDLAEHIRDLYLLDMTNAEVELALSEAQKTTMLGELQYYSQDRLSRMLLVLGDLIKELRVSSNPRLSFEIALTRMVRPESDLTLEALAERIETLERKSQNAAAFITAQSVEVVPGASAPVVGATSQTAEAAPGGAAFSNAAQAAPSSTVYTQPAPAPAASAHPVSTPAASARSVATPAASAQPAFASTGNVRSDSVPTARPQGNPVVQTSDSMQNGAQSVPAVSAAAPTAPAAAIDLSNPAALQRFWHAVTASLRKSNPARGVLFMSARASVDAQGTGIKIEFSEDNSFAYNAAQKPEVRELLAATIQTVAGGVVPFSFELAASATNKPSVASAVMPARSAQSASAPAAQTATPRPTVDAPGQRVANPAAQVPVVTASPVSAAPVVPSAAAPSVTSSAAATSAFAPAVVSRVAASPPTSDAQGFAQQGSSQASVNPASFAGQSAVRSESAAFEEDCVPLDVYDSFAPSEPAAAASYENPGAYQVAQSASVPVPAPASTSAPALEAESTAPVSKEAPSADSQNSVDEAAQIKEMLTASFGMGIKFEDLGS